MADHSIYQKFMISWAMPHQKSRLIPVPLLSGKTDQVSPPLGLFLDLSKEKHAKSKTLKTGHIT